MKICYGKVAAFWIIFLALQNSVTGRMRRHFSQKGDILSRYPGQNDYISPTTDVVGVAGSSTLLPCDLYSSFPDDPAILVLWYKNKVVKPIYSYDIRTGSPMHWKNAIHLNNRADYNPKRGALVIKQLRVEDAAQYRCRVDFKINPTLSYAVNLTVIVPPRELYIYAFPSSMEAGNIVGPYQEADRLRLTCEASGGDPPPQVTWWDGETILDDEDEIVTPNLVKNILIIERLQREDLHRKLTCRASNTKLSSPVQTTVTIDMIFPPRSVKILSSKEPLSIGRHYEVSCRTSGARPAADIVWHLGPQTVPSTEIQVTDSGNITTSTLMISPSITDHGVELKCIGISPPLQKFPVIDRWKLNVFFPPQATIQAGRSLDLSNIEENDDVYFECIINANPEVYKIVWYQNERELYHNVTKGVIVSNRSLVLQKVKKTSAGRYACRTSNIEGDGQSNTIELTIKFAPVCKEQQINFHGAAPNEQINIPCSVDAHPPPNFFLWTFNNSGESVDIPKNHIRKNQYQSTVSYTPKTELDYGTLLCQANNTVGKQVKPCIFHIFPAGRPDPLHNCTQLNFSESSINIKCNPGFDGGLPQNFFVELYNSNRNLVYNLTSKNSNFSISGLPSSTSFDAVVHPFNVKGEGDKYKFRVYTLKDNAEKRTAAIKPAPSSVGGIFWTTLSPLWAIILGVAISLPFVIIIIVSAIHCFRLRKRHNTKDTLPPKDEHGSDFRKASSTQTLIKKASLISDCEEPNPDIIPKENTDTGEWTENNRVASISCNKKLNHQIKGCTSLLPDVSPRTERHSYTTPRKMKLSHYQYADVDSSLSPDKLRNEFTAKHRSNSISSGKSDIPCDRKIVTRKSNAVDMPGSWTKDNYGSKLRSREKDTVEPLLSQRESSV